MSWTFYLDGTALADERVTLDSDTGLTEAAESGVVGFSGVTIDDPDGNLDVRGWQEFYAIEGSATPQRMFTGYVADQTLTRGPWHVGVERQWNVSVADLNTLLHKNVLRGASAKRPQETEAARISWLLDTATGGLSGIVTDTGYVSTGAQVFFEADYTGQYPADVLSDLAPHLAKTFYVFWDSDYGTPTAALYWNTPDTGDRLSSLAISNDVTEWDGTAVIAPNFDAELRIDPSETYSGLFLRWRGGDVYKTNATTAAAHIDRDYTYTSDRIGKQSTAESVAQSFVDNISNDQKERATVTLELDDETVNDVLPGQSIGMHMTHWPGFTTALSGTPSTMRVVHRTVNRHDKPRPDKYLVRLELTESLPKAIGAGGGDFPLPDCQETEAVSNRFDQKTPATSVPTDIDLGSGDYLVLAGYMNQSCADDFHAPSGWTEYHDGCSNGVHPRATVMTSAAIGPTTAECDATKDGPTYSWAATLLGIPGTSGTPTIVQSATYDAEAVYGQDIGVTFSGTPTDGNVLVFWVASREKTLSALAGWTQSAEYVQLYTFWGPASYGYWFQKVASSETTTVNPCEADGTTSFRVIGFELSGATVEAVECPPPKPGQWVYNEVPTPTPDGSTTEFTTAWPFADGSLAVFVDRLNQTAAIVAQDGAAGTFSLAFAPKVGELVEVNYQGR